MPYLDIQMIWLKGLEMLFLVKNIKNQTVPSIVYRAYCRKHLHV